MRRLVLVHGSVAGGERTWRAALPLRERFDVVVVNRPGFPPRPPVPRVDFEHDAAWLAERLQPGDHLVGHSYGGVVVLLAAARRADLGSLTVIEPPATSVALRHPAVRAFAVGAIELWTEGPREPEAFLRAFLAAVGSPLKPPSPLPSELEQGAQALIAERGPWEAEIPLVRLRALPFPKLVVSGAHHPAFDAICDVLERELGAERAVCPGAGHSAQSAPGFNDALLAFLQRAEGT